MMKKEQIIGLVIAVIILVILAVIYFFYLKPKGIKLSKKGKGITTPNDSTDENSSTYAAYIPSTNTSITATTFPLKLGSNGTQVLYLQAALNYAKGKSLVLDGDFGSLTEAALFEGYGVKYITESQYNSFVKPYITQLNVYLQTQGVTI